MAEMEDLPSSLKQLKKKLVLLPEVVKKIIKETNQIADDLDNHFTHVTRAKIGGAVTSLTGGILCAVGFGLSFVTFGASLGLSIAGGIVAGAGGATIGGADIGDFIRSRAARKSTKLLFDEYNSLVEQVKSEFANINPRLEDFGKMETNFPGWVQFWGKLVLGSYGAAKGLGWNVVVKTIMSSGAIASFAEDAARIGATTGKAFFQTLSTAGKGLHVFGGVMGILFMPLDIYTLVDSSKNEHNRNPHKVSKAIRQHAKELAEKCPAKDEIDKMINETINKVTEASINNKTCITLETCETLETCF